MAPKLGREQSSETRCNPMECRKQYRRDSGNHMAAYKSKFIATVPPLVCLDLLLDHVSSLRSLLDHTFCLLVCWQHQKGSAHGYKASYSRSKLISETKQQFSSLHRASPRMRCCKCERTSGTERSPSPAGHINSKRPGHQQCRTGDHKVRSHHRIQ